LKENTKGGANDNTHKKSIKAGYEKAIQRKS